MTRGSTLRAGISKEFRALLPAWLACALTLAAAAVAADPKFLAIALLAYGVGSIALGAQSIGHEYTYRTLGLLLSQPSDRPTLLWMKLCVLASMLAALNAIAWAVFRTNTEFSRALQWLAPQVLWLSSACGLFVAPWLTMLCRSPLAGVVFTITLPLCLLIGGDVVGVVKYGAGAGAQIDELKLAVMWWGTIGLCAVAGIATWRMFMRLQAIEGRGSAIHIPRWFHREIDPDTHRVHSAPGHPVWQLAGKELRLQQMTFVMAGLYCLLWAALSLLQRTVADLPAIPFGALTTLYFGLLSILIGSLASAEERELGTLEWQLLLPMPAWRQWIVKVGMALGLAFVLGIGVPVVLITIDAVGNDFRIGARAWREIVVPIVLLTSGSLYLSSLSTSGVKAMVLSLPVIVGVMIYTQALDSALPVIARIFFDSPVRRLFALPLPAYVSLWLAIAGVLAAVLLRFAYINHRSAERSFGRTGQQVLLIASFVTVAIVLGDLVALSR